MSTPANPDPYGGFTIILLTRAVPISSRFAAGVAVPTPMFPPFATIRAGTVVDTSLSKNSATAYWLPVPFCDTLRAGPNPIWLLMTRLLATVVRASTVVVVPGT